MSVENIIDNFDKTKFYNIINNSTESNVLDVLKKEEINYNDFLVLLSKSATYVLQDIAIKAREITVKRFGKIINFYIPIYLSNECDNGCLYCGFNTSRNIKRTILDIYQIENEYQKIKSLGFDNVLLLTGESSNKAGLEYIIDAVKLAKKYFTFVGLEIYPMSEEDYSRLVEAGVNGLTVYQETYDKNIFNRMHLKGKKKDYNWRINTPDRAGMAGFRKIGLGALLGLSDWRYEAAMLGLHINYLQKNYWKAEFTLGFPRINPPSGDFKIPNPVTDIDFVHMICALRLLLPEVGFVLTTRESPELRNRLIDLCITQISAGSKTNPGGYLCNDAEEQFKVHDDRDIFKMIEVVKHKGYEAVLKDWDSTFAGVIK